MYGLSAISEGILPFALAALSDGRLTTTLYLPGASPTRLRYRAENDPSGPVMSPPSVAGLFDGLGANAMFTPASGLPSSVTVPATGTRLTLSSSLPPQTAASPRQSTAAVDQRF